MNAKSDSLSQRDMSLLDFLRKKVDVPVDPKDIMGDQIMIPLWHTRASVHAAFEGRNTSSINASLRYLLRKSLAKKRRGRDISHGEKCISRDEAVKYGSSCSNTWFFTAMNND